MLSLDEPLDLKLPRRANGKDRGAHSPHHKQVRQLHMTDDGTAIIEPASPASPHSGVQVVPHDRTDTPTPPAVDLSMSPSSRHTPSSPEMSNSGYLPSGVSNGIQVPENTPLSGRVRRAFIKETEETYVNSRGAAEIHS
ncbi:hypothetical protein XENORESO_009520 [Xenotaenia resolanae]|uniref:Uncharacterized protein n=1 Tax=Xenotaenia resolanae TaxID=208358 RepID=A0ABV0X299_9TELE